MKIDDKLDGVSLVPLIQGSSIKENPAIIESRINVVEGITSNTIGVRTSKYKYFRKIDSKNENISLFDLEKDPLEEKNIADLNKDIVSTMEKILKHEFVNR